LKIPPDFVSLGDFYEENMQATIENTAALIPAAGNSGRMGIVVVNPTIFKVLEYRKPSFFKEIEWVVNPEPEKGRMLSLALGLKKAVVREYCFIQNIDQPFATTDLLAKMLRFADEGNYVSPVYKEKGGHPLLINRNIAGFLVNEFKKHDDLRSALKNFERYQFSTDEALICENINTPDDYKRVFGVKMKE
jgi:molybdenum cofactor cytidylyltransferase